MKTVHNAIILLVALACPAVAQAAGPADGCRGLENKDTAAHLEYLRNERSALAPDCAEAAMRFLGAKRYLQARAVLIQYLDYRVQSHMKAPLTLAIYPAVDALLSLAKPVVPDLVEAISDGTATDLARQNAAETIFLIYGTKPDGIDTLVAAAHAESDPLSAARLMDQARRLASRCPATTRKRLRERRPKMRLGGDPTAVVSGGCNNRVRPT